MSLSDDRQATADHHKMLANSRMITCVVPDDGRDRKLIRSLRKEKNILTVNSKQCRGIAMLRPSQAKPGQLPESELVRMLEMIVPESEAQDLFDYVHELAEIDKPGGGIMWMGHSISATRYTLPADVADDTADLSMDSSTP